MNLSYAYLLLTIAIILEILGTSVLKDTNGFTKFYPSVFVLSAFFICLYLMSHVVNFLPVGIAYAFWSGLGIVAITIVAVIKYKQIPNIPTIIGISLIIAGVLIVHLTNDIEVK